MRAERNKSAQKVVENHAVRVRPLQRKSLCANGFCEGATTGVDPALQVGTIRSAASGNSGESAAEKAGGRGSPRPPRLFCTCPVLACALPGPHHDDGSPRAACAASHARCARSCAARTSMLGGASHSCADEQPLRTRAHNVVRVHSTLDNAAFFALRNACSCVHAAVDRVHAPGYLSSVGTDVPKDRFLGLQHVFLGPASGKDVMPRERKAERLGRSPVA